MDLSSKTFLITGTSRGLGEALVDTILTKSKATIVSLSRSISKNQEKFKNDRFIFLKTDLSKTKNSGNFKELKKVITTKELVFINNAGSIYPISKIGEINTFQIIENLNINILSTFLLCNFILNEFKENKITMINISSGAANIPIENWSLYCSGKVAIKMLFDVMAKEYPEHKFFNIDPGVMDTDMQIYIRNSNFKNVKDFIKYKEKGILKKPTEVAEDILKNYI